MIQNPISIEKAKEIGLTHLNRLRDMNLYAFVAGGFLRDSFLGRVAKDIDIYINTPANWTEEQINAAAKSFYDGIGHEYHLHQRREKEAPEAPPVDIFRPWAQPRQNNPEYPTVLRVYASTVYPEDQYPVELIFTPAHMPHSGRFDINLCNILLNSQGRLITPREFTRDVEGKTLTLSYIDDPLMAEMRDWKDMTDEQFEASFTRLKNHLGRIKAKYEDFTVVFSEGLLSTKDGQRAYQLFVEEGSIGDPRAFFQAARQDTRWDEVRLEDGAEDAPVTATRARRRAAGRGIPIPVGLEALLGTVPGGAQVQPGLFDDIAIFDDPAIG